jgi:hypothetical protein
MNKPENKSGYIIMGVNFAPIIVSIANTVAIMVCNMLYRGTGNIIIIIVVIIITTI